MHYFFFICQLYIQRYTYLHNITSFFLGSINSTVALKLNKCLIETDLHALSFDDDDDES